MDYSLSARAIFILLTTSLYGCTSLDEQLLEEHLKGKIAKMSDASIDASDIKLIKEDGYFIGSRKDEDPGIYYVVREVDNQYVISHVLTHQNWAENRTVNNKISSAMSSLASYNLVLETVYDKADSVELIMLDKSERYLHSSYSVKTINSIDDLKTYKFDTCYIRGCEGIQFGPR